MNRTLPLVAVLLLAGCGSRSDQAKLESALSSPGVYHADCSKAGVMNVAGSTADLYSCRKIFSEGPPGPRLCAVWVRDRGYVVTEQARAIFALQNISSPC